QGFRRQRADAHDLADDALRIDQRLAEVDAVDEAAVQLEPLMVRLEVDVENLGDERPAADTRRRIEQRAQTRVLALERLEPLEPRLGLEPLAPELSVLLDQSITRGERVAQRVPRAGWQIDGDTHGIDDDVERLAHTPQMLIATIEQHERDADDGE